MKALAEGDGGELRRGPDWPDARKRAEALRERADAPLPPGFFKTGRDSDLQTAMAAQKDKWSARKDRREARHEIRQTQKAQNAQIEGETKRLIQERAEKKPGGLDKTDIANARKDAESTVLAERQLEKMQKEKVIKAIESNPIVKVLLDSEIAERQRTTQKPLKDGEQDKMRKDIIDRLTTTAMKNVHEIQEGAPAKAAAEAAAGATAGAAAEAAAEAAA
jgi:hypothetical protein